MTWTRTAGLARRAGRLRLACPASGVGRGVPLNSPGEGIGLDVDVFRMR